VRRYGDPQDPTQGDVHYWNVWHGNQPFSNYLTVQPRFCSEFGFQSFAAPELLDRYTEPEDRNITSPVLEHFQRCREGNQKILNHLSRHFRVPVGWENTLYLSQVLQALSIKVACEHWRRLKPRNMGTIIWQLNDIWPAASWASLDCEGRWKMLHYFERHFYAPLLVSAVDAEDCIDLWATSDLNEALSGELTVQLLDFEGSELWSRRESVALDALDSRAVFRFRPDEITGFAKNRARTVLRFRLHCGKWVSENSHFFVPAKALELTQPKLDWELEETDGNITLRLATDTFAPYVWIRHGPCHGVWSDNGMHLYPGEKRILSFTPRHDCNTDELKQTIRIHDLYSAGF
jgi:beta-mannosidase